MILCLLSVVGARAEPGGRQDEARPIPLGTYYDESGDEWIEARPAQLYFHLKYRNIESLAGQYIDRGYDYWVDEHRSILFSMSSNDFAYAEFFINPWHWEDGKVVRRDPESGQATWFELRRRTTDTE